MTKEYPSGGFRPRRVDDGKAVDGLQRTAATISDYRPAARLRLNGGQTDVFLPGEQKRPTTPVVIADDIIRLVPQEGNCRSGRLSQHRGLFTFPNNNQPSLHSVAGSNRKVDALVWNEGTDNQIKVVRTLSKRKGTDIDRRIDYFSVSSVIFTNARGAIP